MILLGKTTRRSILEKWPFLSLIGLALGLAGMLLAYFSAEIWWFILFLPTVSPILYVLMDLPHPCAELSASLSFVFCTTQLLIGNVLTPYRAALLPLIEASLIVMFFLSKKGLLPDNCGQFLGARDRIFHRLSLYLWAVAGLFLLMSGWNIYLLYRQDLFPRADQIALTAATVLFIGILLIFVRCGALRYMDQMEALVDKQYQAELQNFMQVIRSQRHDFNFHLQSISGMIDQKQYSECQTYISTMVKNVGSTNDIMLVRSPALSAMLCTFREIALQKGIELELVVNDDLQNIPCTVYELNTVIGNLIQNAIDEVELHHRDEPWVKVFLLKRGGNNIIRVINPFHGSPEDLQRALSPGYSTKDGKKHEGIGLSSVQRILTRYDGLVFPEFQDGTVSFIAQLPIHYKQGS